MENFKGREVLTKEQELNLSMAKSNLESCARYIDIFFDSKKHTDGYHDYLVEIQMQCRKAMQTINNIRNENNPYPRIKF